MTAKSRTKGIYDEPTGRRAAIRIHGELHQKRFPTGTPDLVLKQWLLATEMRHRKSRRSRTGRFEDDARAYLETVRAMPTFAQRQQHIEAWVAAFGPLRRDSITAAMIAAQLHRWRSEPYTVHRPKGDALTLPGLSPDSVNKRRSALQHLFTVLDGKAAPNPVKDVPKFKTADPAPRAIPYPLLPKLFAAMTDSPSKARLMVLAYTGIPPAQIRRITPEDVDYQAGTVAVAGRHKGAGTAGRIVPLTPDGVKAFKLMRREDAWGAFTSAPLSRAFKRAARAIGLPESFVAYDLRHSFGTEVYRRSGDIRATQLLMGHSTERLTHRYTIAAQDPRVAAAVAQFRRKR